MQSGSSRSVLVLDSKHDSYFTVSEYTRCLHVWLEALVAIFIFTASVCRRLKPLDGSVNDNRVRVTCVKTLSELGGRFYERPKT